ncbi:MAG: PadR family transcriptional regulator [Nitrososphaerota archaeon]|nr:PadR family transcriptional regulator [Nitrososphaerota archaeon]
MSCKNCDSPNEIINRFNHFYILTILYQGPIHGYQIINQYKQRIKKNISPSVVYPFLEELEKNGYLNHTTTLIKEKNRKTYHLTQAGQTYCTNIFATINEIFAPVCTIGIRHCPTCTCTIYKNTQHKTPNNTKTPSDAPK